MVTGPTTHPISQVRSLPTYQKIGLVLWSGKLFLVEDYKEKQHSLHQILQLLATPHPTLFTAQATPTTGGRLTSIRSHQLIVTFLIKQMGGQVTQLRQ